MSKITMVCELCGSDDVSRDATARWQTSSQEWVITGLHDGFYCDHCDSECDLEEEEIE